MLTAIPKGWFSWDFLLRETNGDPIAELRLSSWCERGSVVVGGVTYRIYRKRLLGPFVMEAPDGSIVGSATKLSAFRREFVLADSKCSYALKAVSAFRRNCRVFRNEQEVGAIQPDSWLSRRASAKFADDVPPNLRAFLIWLTLLMWRRESAAARRAASHVAEAGA